MTNHIEVDVTNWNGDVLNGIACRPGLVTLNAPGGTYAEWCRLATMWRSLFWRSVPRGCDCIRRIHDSYEVVPLPFDVEQWAELANGPPPVADDREARRQKAAAGMESLLRSLIDGWYIPKQHVFYERVAGVLVFIRDGST